MPRHRSHDSEHEQAQRHYLRQLQLAREAAQRQAAADARNRRARLARRWGLGFIFLVGVILWNIK